MVIQRRRNLQRQTEEACKISAARSHGLSPRLSIAWCLKVAMLPERRKRDGVLQRLARTISSTSHRPLNIQYQGQDFSAPMSFENLRPWSRVSRIHRSVNFIVSAGHFAQPCNTIESETALMPVLTNTHTQTSQRIIDTCIQCTACSSCTAHSILALHAFKPWCERRARRLKGNLEEGSLKHFSMKRSAPWYLSCRPRSRLEAMCLLRESISMWLMPGRSLTPCSCSGTAQYNIVRFFYDSLTILLFQGLS